MKRYITLLFLSAFTGIIYAQTADEALRYSQQNHTGTARSTAMGGAFGALGGDYSSIGINPAGLAVYQSSEFTFTPTIGMRKNTSGKLSDDRYTFGLSNIGYVTTFKPRINSKDGWQNINFGIGYNKINNFKKASISEIENSPNSMLDEFAINANGRSPMNLDAFYEGLAFDTYLIDTIPGGNGRKYDIPIYTEDLMYQKKNIEQKGRMGEFNLSLGANYSHKLYIGASLGFQSIYHKSTDRYEEMTYEGSTSSLYNYFFNQYTETSGVGVNLKLGLIYKPHQNIRLGAAVHTPTFFSMEDTYRNEMISYFDPELFQDEEGNSSFYAESPTGSYKYNLRTPMKFTLSGALILSQKAIISLDYDFTDYSSAKFSDNTNSLDYTNTEIKDFYKNTNNLRAGLEYRVSSVLSLRGGFSHFGNPYKHINEPYNIYSTGFGIRQGNFFFDAAYSYSHKEESFTYYSSSDIVDIKDENHQVRLTFGFKF